MLPNDHVAGIGHEGEVRAQAAGRDRAFQRSFIKVLKPNVEEVIGDDELRLAADHISLFVPDAPNGLHTVRRRPVHEPPE